MPISEKQKSDLESLILKLERCTDYKAKRSEVLSTLASLISILSSQSDLLLKHQSLSKKVQVNVLFHQHISQEEHVLAALNHLANEGRKLLKNVLEQSESGNSGMTQRMNMKA